MTTETLKEKIVKLVGKSDTGIDKKTIIEATSTKGIVLENVLKKLQTEKIISVEMKDGEKIYSVAPEKSHTESPEEIMMREDDASPNPVGKKNVKKEKPAVKINGEEADKRKTTATKGKKEEGRDMRRYKFLGKEHTKGGLVHAVISEYVRKHRNISVGKLKETFPDELLQRFGVFQVVKVAKTFTSGGRERFLLKSGQILQLKDGSIAICNQWTASNISPFLKEARKYFDIK